MEVTVGDKRIEIDMDKIMCGIDSVLHDELTDKTGVTVCHNDIIRFVSGIVREHNVRELRLWRAMEQEVERSEKLKKEIDNKIKRGRVVSNTNSFWNKVKYHLIGYVCVENGVDKSEGQR